MASLSACPSRLLPTAGQAPGRAPQTCRESTAMGNAEHESRKARYSLLTPKGSRRQSRASKQGLGGVFGAQHGWSIVAAFCQEEQAQIERESQGLAVSHSCVNVIHHRNGTNGGLTVFAGRYEDGLDSQLARLPAHCCWREKGTAVLQNLQLDKTTAGNPRMSGRLSNGSSA